MNTERLQTLASFLRGVPKEHFNLGTWRGVNDDFETDVTDAMLYSPSCGTTACAVGWACSMPEFQAQGLWFYEDSPQYAGYESWSAVIEFFGVDYTYAQRLFSGSWYEAGDKATAVGVADRIEVLIKEHT